MCLKQQIIDKQKQISQIQGEINDIVDKHVPSHVNTSFGALSAWRCKESPFGLCYYDGWHDTAHDSCVFCGEPEERK